jgi:hypothetical protein
LLVRDLSFSEDVGHQDSLAAGTRECRLRIVQRFLLSRFAGRPLKFEQLAPEDIRRFHEVDRDSSWRSRSVEFDSPPHPRAQKSTQKLFNKLVESSPACAHTQPHG